MGIDSIVGLIAFTIIFILEYYFPFFKFPDSKIKHDLTNLSIALFNTAIVFLAAAFFAVCVDCFNQRFDGVLAILNNYLIVKVAAAVIIFDLWMYIWHRLNHEVPFLWRFHRVHHTDLQMDSSTALRFHPIELIISYLLNILILGLLGLNFAFLIVYKTLMFPVIIFHHSNVGLSEAWDRFFGQLFVMPNMHRIHHSERMEETNSNYGSIFSFWDRIFKTYRTRRDIRSIVLGIGAFKTNWWQSVPGLLLTPFRSPIQKSSNKK